MNPGLWVALAAVVVALAFGLWRAATDGRFRAQPHPAPDSEPEPVWTDGLGERATLLQFSSAFCQPCRATRRVLEDVAANHDGVAHVEVDAESHLDDVRRLGIMRTPTTLVLDPAGRELGRAVGAPTKQQVEASLPT